MGCFCTQMPISLTILGWSYCLSILPSCKNFFLCSSGRVTRQVLTATSWPLFFSWARYTSPKFPYDFSYDSVISLRNEETHPSNFIKEQHVVIVEFPSFSGNGFAENSARSACYWQTTVILIKN